MSTELTEVLSVCRRIRGNNHETGAHYLLGYMWAYMSDEDKERILNTFKLEDNNG